MKRSGGFDGTVKTFEDFELFRKPLMNYLTVPLLIIGLDRPESFEIKHYKKRSNLILQSSATSGRPSSVSIDKITARRQVQTMSRVLVNFLGEKKRPFIIVDADPRNASRASMGARVAATSGFLNFSKKQTYILKESVNPSKSASRCCSSTLGEWPERCWCISICVSAKCSTQFSLEVMT